MAFQGLDPAQYEFAADRVPAPGAIPWIVAEHYQPGVPRALVFGMFADGEFFILGTTGVPPRGFPYGIEVYPDDTPGYPS